MKKLILLSLTACLFATACNKDDLELTKDGLPAYCAPNEIIYKTKYGYPIALKEKYSYFGGAKLVANLCENGYCKYVFDADITQIPQDGFSGSVSLISMIIPNSVTSIGQGAFSDCDSLTSVTIGNSVTSIGWYAFSECTSLTSVTIPNSVISIGGSAFSGCTGELIIDSKIIETDYTSNNCPSKSWLSRSNFTKLIIGNNITKIGAYAFKDCTSLTSVTIPDSVTSIGDSVFAECTSLTSVTIPDSVTSIGGGAFEGCTGELIINSKIIETDYNYDNHPSCAGNWLYGSNFTKLTIDNNITKIGSYAFYKCTSLISATIGNSVTSIGRVAFSGCTSLTSVYCKPTTPPAGVNYMFDNNASGRKIYVPRNSVEAYKAANGWSKYASDIVGYDF